MTAKKTIADTPAVPAVYEVADVAAIQALVRGEANEEQQKRALKWVIERGAGTYDFHYYDGERNTAFALGRAFVGQQVVKLTRLNLHSLRRGEHG
tara:strand:- start:1825 stop:2109 length:285 start_codon:yes stop_codon:yes gene_type:complete